MFEYEDTPPRRMSEPEIYAWCVGIYGTLFVIVYYLFAGVARLFGKKLEFKRRKVFSICYAIPAMGGAAFWAAGEVNTRLES